MSKPKQETKVCHEGLVDHKGDQRDYSIPLYFAGIIIIAVLVALFN